MFMELSSPAVDSFPLLSFTAHSHIAVAVTRAH